MKVSISDSGNGWTHLRESCLLQLGASFRYWWKKEADCSIEEMKDSDSRALQL